ncbi:MAG: hypothetical protein HETSPECPRED_010304 [Heterodermia speciosa]|uniref:DUF803-domain-containing protein n=1 Tax=Heterodermia speciosa TaxID=116794 RepID=A0A8H3G1K6_9LECA|nr:MAG: hypothetical protein HETSPECPRED_010304 [Heterodermia speciosa]
MTDFNIVIAISGDTAAKIREWSSVIGIVTAIIGNILISFALNIQRYAHIRLGQEQRAGGQEENGGPQKYKQKSYGTQQQSKIAEDRASANLNSTIEGPALVEEEGGNNRRNDFMPATSIRPRSSHSDLEQSEKQPHEEQRKSYLRSPYWWAGIILMIVGEAGNFLAYGFAPASIVAPLGVVALVSNCIIAPCLLKERFRQRDFWGVMVAAAGAVVVVLSAKTSETKIGPEEIWGAITRWEFELYLGITAFLIIALMWASGKYGERTILIDLGLVGLYGTLLLPDTVTVLIIDIGGYTALSTKGIASLLSYTLWHALTFPVTYLLVFILAVSALLQIRYVNRALQRFSSTQVIPTQFVLFTISVIIGSAVLYRDFESATAERVGKFVGGCILTFSGVYLITSARGQTDNDRDDVDLDNEENGIGLIDEERYQDEAEERTTTKDRMLRYESTSSTRLSNPPHSRSPHRTSRQRSDGPSSLPRTPHRTPSTVSDLPLREHSTPASPSTLLENPWQSPQDQSARPRALETTISAPLLPTEAQITDPLTPNTTRRQPDTPRKIDRPSTLTRASVARMLPGPFISPLSSPLSAIVADSLRRGVDLSSPTGRRRPGLSALRKSRSQRSSGGDEESSPLRPGMGATTTTTMEHPSPKGRSFSVSLGEFFRLKKGERETSETDVEARGGSEEERS